MNLEPPPIDAPDLRTSVKAVHVASGVGVLPMRVLITRLVPVGTWLDQIRVPQLTAVPESKTRERKVPGDE